MPTLNPDAAYELTVTITVGPAATPPPPPVITYQWRKVAARALSGLPLGDPAPTYRLEILERISGLETLLYHRPFARPEHVEAHGTDSVWTRLPTGHQQVLVALLPYYESPHAIQIRAFQPFQPVPWLDITISQQ